MDKSFPIESEFDLAVNLHPELTVIHIHQDYL